MWERVVGQDRAVALLHEAANRPSHAYLLVGPKGSGVEDAALCFAADLIGLTDDPNSADRVLRGRHPDVIEFEPEGLTFRIKEDIREGIIPEASRSPIEGNRKVLVIHQAERLREDAANALLKTIEEPPTPTVMILVTPTPDELLDTVQSRCQRVDFASLPTSIIANALETEGTSQKQSTLIAGLSGGQLDRARELAGTFGPVRTAFLNGASHLDGTGAMVAQVVEELKAILDDATNAIQTANESELAKLEAEIEQAGYPDRAAQALRTKLKKQHERSERRVRIEGLIEGITVLESVYRDVLSPEHPLNTDSKVLAVSANDATKALDACAAARRSLEFNPNEGLLLEQLFLHLPVC